MRDADEPQGRTAVGSLVGCYLYSVLNGDMAHAAEHERQLSSGQPPVMQAELIVVRLVFESLIQRVFESTDDSAVDAFAARLPASSVVDEGEMTAVIRAALAGGPIPYRGMDSGRLFTVWIVASGVIVRDERLGAAAAGELVCRGERDAARLGIRLASAHPA